MFYKTFLIYFFTILFTYAQFAEELAGPSNIKSIVFKGADELNQFPIIFFGQSVFLEFDDLNGDEKDYYYKINYYNHDWKKSDLFKSEYIDGFDNIRIENYQNSFNTLQPYTHYKLELPNSNTNFKLPGNYMIEIYDELDQLLFSRTFLINNDTAIVSSKVFRSREMDYYDTHQSIHFSIIPKSNIPFRDPENLLNVVILKNEQWSTIKTGQKPQFISGNRLEYSYDNKSLFEGGNEYFFFDTKDIRINGNGISYVNLNRLYETYLYTSPFRKNLPYGFAPDINGNFLIRTIQGTQLSDYEADYSWVHFSLAMPRSINKKEVYIYGKFNNYVLGEENRMIYNPSLEIYEGILLLKQGFYNYKFVEKDSKKLSINSISGNHALTENNYLILVYYKKFGDRYDSLVGVGKSSSFEIVD
ncbi:MAG: DUF5103 domain-containing protein [Flavobacteriaceae bacterium]|jgi:hypothetical protein|nr:DUF5103 domain-containing protein [Flavobacteriaceae bacterium]